MQQMLMVMGIMSSNPDKKDDAIDGALLRAWDKMTSEQGAAAMGSKRGQVQMWMMVQQDEYTWHLSLVTNFSMEDGLVYSLLHRQGNYYQLAMRLF